MTKKSKDFKFALNLLSSTNVPLTIDSKATELVSSKGSCKYRHT